MLTAAKLIECVETHRATVWPMLEKIDYQPGGILPSDALMLCCLGATLGVTTFNESGRRFGYSTDCLASAGFVVNSIENHSENNADTDARLKAKHFINLRLFNGDGSVVIPRLIAQSDGQTAVLLDGPKGPAALDVVDEIIDKVVFAAIHDLSQQCERPGGSRLNVSRLMAKTRYPDVLFTDAPEITEAYGHMDERAWKGTYGSRSELTACGSTLGIFGGGQWRE